VTLDCRWGDHPATDRPVAGGGTYGDLINTPTPSKGVPGPRAHIYGAPSHLDNRSRHRDGKHRRGDPGSGQIWPNLTKLAVTLDCR
jgi:hypothetical protein